MEYTIKLKDFLIANLDKTYHAGSDTFDLTISCISSITSTRFVVSQAKVTSIFKVRNKIEINFYSFSNIVSLTVYGTDNQLSKLESILKASENFESVILKSTQNKMEQEDEDVEHNSYDPWTDLSIDDLDMDDDEDPDETFDVLDAIRKNVK